MTDLTAHQQPTVAAIFEGWEKRPEEPRRGYLGGSILGRECSRQLWYAFRWARSKSFEGRMLRLFDRGHREEETMVAELRRAGVTVHDVDQNGDQFGFSDVGGHVRGHMDGAALGIKEAPRTWHVLEFKTHNDRSFERLVSSGVQKAKPEHWAQMMLYMGWSGMTRAFYLAVNKNDDRLYSERVKFDEQAFEQLVRKAWGIVQAATPLERISEKADFYLCRWCEYAPICHGEELADVSCRSCAHATPETDGDARWSCARWGTESLTVKQQEAACNEHRFIPALVPHSDPVDADDRENWVEYAVRVTGSVYRNGAKGENSYTSRELRNLDPKLIGDAKLEEIRKELAAEVAG